MRRIRYLLTLLCLVAGWSLNAPGFLGAPAAAQEEAGSPVVHVLTLRGTINPAAADYIQRGVQEAQEASAAAVVLQLDTPGGLDGSMREIVQAIDNATVPVLVYVTPKGGRAASAGAFITMAADLAAMAPGTTIGSATPISMGQGGEAQELPEDLRRKVINDAASYIKAHAELHDRNAEWAEKAVREGANLPADDAAAQDVVELLATDLAELLDRAHGLEVHLATGTEVVLDTGDATLVPVDMTLVEDFLHTISNPNIAFILLSLGSLGLVFELLNPGAFFPGIAGGISLLLGFYSLGTLDAHWGGVLLIVLAIALFVADVFTPTNGLLSAGGVAALVLGGLVLFSGAPEGIRVSPWSLGIVSAVAGGFVVVVLQAIHRSRRRDLAPTGYGSLVGAVGVARSDLHPEGMVIVNGERWRATTREEGIEEGTRVVVEQAEGMTLTVKRAE